LLYCNVWNNFCFFRYFLIFESNLHRFFAVIIFGNSYLIKQQQVRFSSSLQVFFPNI
jgi:hypothetical protein